MSNANATSSNDNATVRALEPKTLWNHFADLNAVPRPSKQEARVIEFAKSFGESLGLATEVDEAGNVLIRKPATSGMEDRVPIVMQSHLDMVHQKNADTDFDFSNQGIAMEIDGDWVKAKGTTLGADNGIGVATIMAILASDDIAHPAMEALFTIDEETGMTGAKALKPNWLTGKILLNLDTEEDNELTIGCAGGVDVSARMTYSNEPVGAGQKAYKMTISGLVGGHSGMDIHRGRGNANKMMNRLLYVASKQGARVASIDGGSLRNAIPRESNGIFVVPEDASYESWFAAERDALLAEYRLTDPDLKISCSPVALPSGMLPEEMQTLLLASIFGTVNGIVRMSPSIGGLVQTSNNLARVLVKDGRFEIDCLARSSVDSERAALARSLGAVLETTGAEIKISGDYPGWEPDPNSSIVQTMKTIYEQMFGQPPHVAACHAGLECGLLGKNYPQMEMISFGPTIRGAHSPDEKVSVSSVQKYWSFVKETLQQIPAA